MAPVALAGRVDARTVLLADDDEDFRAALADPRITTEFYGHLAPGCLRGAIDRLAFESQPAPADGATCAAAGTAGEPPNDADPLPDPIPLRPFAAPRAAGGSSSGKSASCSLESSRPDREILRSLPGLRAPRRRRSQRPTRAHGARRSSCREPKAPAASTICYGRLRCKPSFRRRRCARFPRSARGVSGASVHCSAGTPTTHNFVVTRWAITNVLGAG
jgi:hypothetical protein